VADMTSNFLTRPVDVNKFGLFYASAQKNLGIAGLAVIVLRRDLLGLAGTEVPTLLNYSVYSRTDSVPNTPPVFQLYVANLMAQWIEAHGGVAVMDEYARARAKIVYDAIDAMPEMYVSHVERESRSRVNAVFRLKDEALTALFVKEAAEAGLANLAGHRAVGGIRASMYNAMPIEGVQKLADFMKTFAHRHGRTQSAVN
jgi:phosphoserine aminotransferase